MTTTSRPPLVFRLMLFSIFLPVCLTTGCILFHFCRRVPEFWETRETVLNVPMHCWALIFLGLPILLGLCMLWTGRWRNPLLLAGTFYYGVLALAPTGWFGTYVPPEKRLIHWHGSKETDVYCNGVHLGRLPLKISVAELKAKVPEWTAPPSQRWYVPGAEPIYTWFPWDDFRLERFEQAKELSHRTSEDLAFRSSASYAVEMAGQDADCRFWWRFENGKTSLCVRRRGYNYHLHQPYADVTEYYISNAAIFSPSAPFHAQLLTGILTELSSEEKKSWNRHVLKHWELLAPQINRIVSQQRAPYRSGPEEQAFSKLLEEAFLQMGLMKYGLSDPPTEAEVRSLLEDWIEKSADDKMFAMHYGSFSPFASTELPFAYIGYNSSLLIDPLLKKFKETFRGPVSEQLRRRRYDLPNAWAPLIYTARIDRHSDYFADLARYTATTWNGLGALLANEDERTIPLFQSLLSTTPLSERMTRKEYRYERPIQLFSGIDNPKLEPIYRNYVKNAISDPKLSEYVREQLNQVILQAITQRAIQKETNKEDLIHWVQSLPLRSNVKDRALRNIRFQQGDPKTLSDFMQKVASGAVLVETRLNIDDVARWFREHPDGSLELFFLDHEEDFRLSVHSQHRNRYGISFSDGEAFGGLTTLNGILASALLRADSEPAREVVEKLWNNGKDRQLVFNGLASAFDLGVLQHVGMEYATVPARLPEYLFDLFDAITDPTEFSSILWLLPICDSPRSRDLLAQWSETEVKRIKSQAQTGLEMWNTRNLIRKRQKELFIELVEETIQPDELLQPQAPWTWQDGRYETVSK